MKWNGPFRLLLVLSLAAPSVQRFVPDGASPSSAGQTSATETDSSTRSLFIEMEVKGNTTTPPGPTSTSTTIATQPLKIEIDKEKTVDNMTGSPSDGALPAWHPYLIKISSGTGPPETTHRPTLTERTVILEDATTSTAQLIIEELSVMTPLPATEPTTGSANKAMEAAESVLLVEELEELEEMVETPPPKDKRKKKQQPVEPEKPKPETPTRKQKAGPPVNKPKTEAQEIVNDTLLPPVTKVSIEQNETEPPQVLLVIREIDPNSTALKQQSELPVSIQIISTNTKETGISVKDKDTVTSAPSINIKVTDIVTTAPSTSAPDINIKDIDIVTKAPGISIEDIYTVTSTPGISNRETVTSAPSISIKVTDIVTNAPSTSAPGISTKDIDTVTKALVNSLKDIDTIIDIKDRDSITSARGINIKDRDTLTKAPGIIPSAPGISIKDRDTLTIAPGIIPSAPGISIKDRDTVTIAPGIIPSTPGISIKDRDTVTSTPGISIKDRDTVTSTPGIGIKDRDTVTSAPGISTSVSGIRIKNKDTVTSTPGIIINDIKTNVDSDSEVDDTIIGISDNSISVEAVMDKVTAPEPHFKELYFDQLVDHFSFISHQKLYRQRYLLTDQFWGKSFGPIFLYTGNEGDIWDFANSSRFIIELASEQQAMVIFAEHRYYGKSLPFGKKSYEKSNIEFLTVEQAVADYVVLITKLKTDLDAEKCAVIAFGGSYGGMLSAYIRIKYPNVVDGALASSAPVVSTANLGDGRQFFHDVTEDFERNSPDCVLKIRKAFQQLESLAQQQAWSKITSKLCLCKSVKSKKEVEHLYGWARNAFTYLAMFNYPYKTEAGLHFPPNPVDVACRYILKKSDHIEGLLDILGIFYNSTGNKKCFDIYSEYIHCSDPTGCGLGPASQAWDFQACTEINLLYESNNDTDMFPAIPFTEAMRKNYCHSKWGVYPNPEWLKIQYWGDDFKAASNIIFSNGDLDPWANGGILKTVNPSVVAFLIEGGAHHLDLRGSTAADPASVTAIRRKEASIIKDWVKKHQLHSV